MSFRKSCATLATAAGCLTAVSLVSPAIAAPPPASRPMRTVTYDGVSLRVPASWRVVDLARHPRACPRLDVHAVYLGKPGPDPACSAELRGKTEAVALTAVRRGSPDLRQATRATVVGGRSARTNPDAAVTHTITDFVPSARVEISLSYGRHRGLIRYIERSIRITGAARSAGLPTPAAVRPAAAQGTFRGAGFDTCAAPSATAMRRWLGSPYRAVGIYIGGINRACAQANLTAAWIKSIQAQGWHYFPMYVGLQASCVAGFGNATIKAASAAAEGRAAADDAVTQAAGLGIGSGTPIIYDMEAYRGGCGQAVTTFLSAWDSELHARGYVAGVYESFSNISDLIAASGQMTEPDVIHYADWDGHATTASSYMPSDRWTSHQRIHQYKGGHNETYAGTTLNIDNDQLDVALSGGSARAPGQVRPRFRAAVAINANGSAEWFARALNRTVRHNYQHPVGSPSWWGTRAVGNSPANLASNPAVTINADGRLTLFARTGAGGIVHAWQQPGAPNMWHWGGRVQAGALPGSAVADPGAIKTAAGPVEVFVTLTGGRVVTTRQRSASGNTSWTPWASLGGSCAGTPVPVLTSGRAVEVFCVTAGGGLSVDTATDGAWSGWQAIGGGPAGLTGTPAAVTAASGQTEVFATTRAGRLAYAWQSGGGWSWGGSPAGGVKIRNSPAATTWPGGGVGVFAQQAGGRLGFAVQSGGGAAGWASWTPLSSRMLGSPAAWTNAGGSPEVVILNKQLRIAVSTFAGGTWSGWTQLGGGY